MERCRLSSAKLKTILWRTVFALLVLCLVTAHFSFNFAARYASGDDNDDGARVAKFDIAYNPDLNTEYVANLEKVANLKPGDSITQTVQITNNSEVAVEYTLTVTSQGNLPLYIKIDDNAQNLYGDAKNGNLATSGSGTNVATHTITIEWKLTDNEVEFQNRPDLLTIHLNCAQTD